MSRITDLSAALSQRLNDSLATRDAALLLLRVMVGVVFVFHGAQKLFGSFGGYGLDGTAWYFGEKLGLPLPYASAVLAGGAEFFGGALLIVGLLFRPAAAIVAFTMLVATLVHLPYGFEARAGGAEYTLTLLTALVALALLGPGRWTAGRALSLAKPQAQPAVAH
jgi:putative oxidoreductase